MPGARVVLTERGSSARRTAVSNTAGKFEYLNVTPAEYLLEASAGGLGTSKATEVEVREGVAQTADLRLDVARVISQVQVTAAGIAQTVDEQSKALDILDGEQLERRAEFSVAEALRTVPGMRVLQSGGPGSLTRVMTRGMRPTDTSFLIDGFRLRDAASPQGDAQAFISDLLITDIDRIEVLRGSGSSLYGTHATAGVVNLITDQGGGRWRGDLSTEGGGLGLFRGSARFSGGALQDRLSLSGGLTHLNVTRGADEDDRARNSSAHAFARYQLAPRTTVSGRAMLANTFTQLNDSPFLNSAGALVVSPNDPDSRRMAWSQSVLATVRHSFTPGTTVAVNYSGVVTNRDNRDGPAGTRFEPAFNNSSVFDGRIDTVQARGDFAAGRNFLFTAGYEFERENFDNIATDQNPNLAARTNARLKIVQSSNSAFGQAQGRFFGGRLQLMVSGRLQRFQLSDRPAFTGGGALYQNSPMATPPNARTGDVSLAYMVTPTTKFRSHVGNGYRAPALYERFGSSFFGGSFSGYGDPRLKPERLLAMDAGVEQYLANSKVKLSGTYFYTQVQEAIFFDFSGAINPATDPFGRFGGYRNTRGGLARGVEASVEANPTRTLTLQGSYTHTRSLDRVSQYATGLLRSPRVSDHMFTAVATQRLGRRIDVTFDMFAASDYYFPLSGRAFRFDGPVRGDLAVSWTKPLTDRQKIRVFTRVENLFNREIFEEGFRTPGAWAVGGVKWMF